MSGRRHLGFLALGPVVVALAWAAPTAFAATTIGSATGEPTTNTTFCAGEVPCSLYNQNTGGQPAVVVPTNGVIVGWRLNSGSVGNLAALQVLRPTGSNFTGAGTSAQVTVTALGPRDYSTRLPVKAGDVLGLQNADDGLFMEASAEGGVGAFKPPLADGGIARPADGVDPGRRLLLEAVLEPDADGDGFGDESQDGCPANPLVQTSGCPAIPATATTAAIPATPGIQARLSLSPDPTCTGVRTFFDMSGSTTPNPPITDYRLTYQVLPYPAYLSIILGTGLEAVGFGLLGGGTQLLESNVVETAVDRFLATQPSAGLYESPESSHAFDFTWNRAIKGSPYQKFETGPVVRADINGYARDPLVVTLTVRDRTGASSRVTRFLEFAQVYSAGHLGVSRTGCPKVKVLAHVPAYAFDKLSVASLSAQTIAVKIPCATSSPCAGNFSAYRIAANTATATAASAAHAAKSTPVLIARSDFFTVPGKSSATIRATLTKAGQALARRHEPVPASVRVTSVSSATGRQATHSTRITLPYKKSK